MNIKDFKNNIKNILLIRRNNIGDMICAIPVFKTIRQEFPQAHITVFADSTNAGILKGASFIDDVIIYKKGHGIYRNKYLNYWGLFKQNKNRFDLAIALKVGFSSTSALITLISKARIRAGCVPEKWHPLQHCYNLPVRGWKKWKTIPHIDALLTFIKTIGIENPVKDISIEITSDSRNKAKDFLKETQGEGVRGRVVVFNISNNKPENRWHLHKFKELGNMLYQNYGATSIITSAPSDMDEAIILSKQIEGRAFYGSTSKKCSIYFDTPEVMDFAALVAESDLLICGEGGAMHVGAAVSSPTISLWSSLRPRKWAPYGEKQFMIVKGEHVDSILVKDVIEIIDENKLLLRSS